MEYTLNKPLFPINENSTLVERVFANRGIDPHDVEHYLHTTQDDVLDPLLIDNMEEGAKMLIQHIAQNDNVLIQVDSDCDGFTSAATLINYLNCHFPGFVQNHISYRIHTGKQHGILAEMVQEIISAGYKLVICPDSSSNDYEQHWLLKEAGIDVLVIDHHEADKVSENAVVINNQLCNYPTKSLSGVGMVYKFCCYLDSIMGVNTADNFLDLVALGLVGDMMDLRDFETRHLVVRGINQIRNPFLKEMVKKQDYSISRAGGLCPFAESFYIVPQINATIRMGTAEEKLMLFESMLDFRGLEQIPSTKRGCKGQVETRVEQACRNCTNIKNRQTKARDASLNTIEHTIEENKLLENKILTVKLGPECATDKNLTGLIANQLMAKYQRPVLLLSYTTDKENGAAWMGSGRGYDKSKFDDLRKFLKDSNLVFLAEGHANALGVGIADDKIDQFIEYSNYALKDFDFTPCYRVDFIFSASDFRPKDIIDIADLKSIWGQGVEEPLVAFEHINVTKDRVQLMSRDKNPTLKITLPNGMSLIKFGSSDEEYESLCSESGCVTINVVGTCNKNEWNGVISPQIMIEDYEIVSTSQYYF